MSLLIIKICIHKTFKYLEHVKSKYYTIGFQCVYTMMKMCKAFKNIFINVFISEHKHMSLYIYPWTPQEQFFSCKLFGILALT